ncbi:MAG: hypothetical protein KGH89_09145 [Thaumarchaeota archaeon]|nr:hypothetical protein [Nitrososphaerota archaeon]
MKTLIFSIIAILAVGTSFASVGSASACTYCPLIPTSQPIQADNASDIQIQDIHVQPSTVKVGDTLTVYAMLVNNSTDQIFVVSGVCEAPFSVTFDNNVAVNITNKICNAMAILQKINPGEKTTATSPSQNLVYRATGAGTVNATVTFLYSIKNQTDPNLSEIQKTVSKSFSFTIYGNNTETNPQTIMINESPLEQFKTGITVTDVKCPANYALTIRSEDGSPACVRPSSVKTLMEKGWSKFESAQSNHASNAKTNPFGIAGLIIYYGGGPCGVGTCPLNMFNLKITSNYTAYLLGYNICDGDSCTKSDNLNILLPISNVSTPNFKTIALPEDLNWKYKDTMHIQIMASAIPENETAVSIDLGNSTTIP